MTTAVRSALALAATLAVGALAAPASAAPGTLGPAQRIVLQEQARKNDPRVIGTSAATQAASLSPVQRIIRQENASRNDPRLFGTTPAVPDPDLKSSYPQLHQVLSGAVRTPAAVETGNSGVDWRDAGLGALVGAFAAGLLGSVALRLRRSRLPALR